MEDVHAVSIKSTLPALSIAVMIVESGERNHALHARKRSRSTTMHIFLYHTEYMGNSTCMLQCKRFNITFNFFKNDIQV